MPAGCEASLLREHVVEATFQLEKGSGAGMRPETGGGNSGIQLQTWSQTFKGHNERETAAEKFGWLQRELHVVLCNNIHNESLIE